MSENRLSSILATLPSLSQVELDAVIATATALKAVKQAKPARRPRQPKADAGKKGPVKQVSEYSDLPEYKAFKASDKELKALLKVLKTDLRGLEGIVEGSSETKLDGPEVENAKRVYHQFLTTRNEWFRVKADTKSRVGEGAAAAPAPSENRPAQPAASAADP